MTDLQELMAALDAIDDSHCRCHEAYTSRGMQDPGCNCDTAEDVAVLRNFLRSPAFAEMAANAAIGRVVWNYIDRMNDVCPHYDPAEVILSDFTKAVEPHIRAACDAAMARSDAAALAGDAQRHGRGEGK